MSFNKPWPANTFVQESPISIPTSVKFYDAKHQFIFNPPDLSSILRLQTIGNNTTSFKNL